MGIEWLIKSGESKISVIFGPEDGQEIRPLRCPEPLETQPLRRQKIRKLVERSLAGADVEEKVSKRHDIRSPIMSAVKVSTQPPSLDAVGIKTCKGQEKMKTRAERGDKRAAR